MLKIKSIILILFFISINSLIKIDSFLFHPKIKCQISLFKGGKEFTGEKIMANKSFIPHLKTIGMIAKGCKVHIHVIDSYKQLKNPTDYVLTSQMPLALGRGIHFDLQDLKGSILCNKLCMISRSWKTLPEASCFIENIQKKGLKFIEPNLLHDGYTTSLKITELENLKVETQKLCSTKSKTI